MPEVKAHTKGIYILLKFEKDIGPAFSFACDNTYTMFMAKTAEIIRCKQESNIFRIIGLRRYQW